MTQIVLKPNAWNGSEGYNVANKVGESVLTLLWLRSFELKEKAWQWRA